LLRRPLIARVGVVTTWIVATGLGIWHCGSGEPVRTSSQPIIGGSLADAPDSPVLLLQGPQGGCSAVLVAPTLVATARHCVASTTPGGFSCAASGEVVNTGNGAGQLGTDNDPSTLSFFSTASANVGPSGMPDAVGVRIISTQTPTACRDDLAFVVLDRAIPGLVPAPIRITRATSVGEQVSVWGYGLTDHLEPAALRVASGVPIAGVGPDVAPESTQLAPVRSVRVGPVTCQGDSGGPILSAATGAVIALVSLGSQAGTTGPYCTKNELADTTGPRLAAYHDWILTVFQEAGASPVTEDSLADASTQPAPLADAFVAPGDSPASDDRPVADEPLAASDGPVAEGPGSSDSANEGNDALSLDGALDALAEDSAPSGSAEAEQPQWRTGASCATSGGGSGRGPTVPGAVLVAMAWTAAAVGRRRG